MIFAYPDPYSFLFQANPAPSNTPGAFVNQTERPGKKRATQPPLPNAQITDTPILNLKDTAVAATKSAVDTQVVITQTAVAATQTAVSATQTAIAPPDHSGAGQPTSVPAVSADACQQIIDLARQQKWDEMRKLVIAYSATDYTKYQQQCGWYQDQARFAADIDLRRILGILNTKHPEEGYQPLKSLNISLLHQQELPGVGSLQDELAYTNWLRVSLALCDLPAGGGLTAAQNTAISVYFKYHVGLYPKGPEMFQSLCGIDQAGYFQELTKAALRTEKPEKVDLSSVPTIAPDLPYNNWPCIFSSANGTFHVKLSTGKYNDFDPGCTIPGLPAGIQSWKQFESLDIRFCGYLLPDQYDHGYGFFIGSNGSGSGLRLEKTASDLKSKAVLFQLAQNSLQQLQSTASLADGSPLNLLKKDQCASFFRVKILMAGNLVLWQVTQSGADPAPRIALALPAGLLDIETQKLPLSIGFLTWQKGQTLDQPKVLFSDLSDEPAFSLMEVAP